MPSERRIPQAFLKGATFDKDGDVVSPPFTEEESEAAWQVFSVVRDVLAEGGATTHPPDPLRACLWAACQWMRIGMEAAAMQAAMDSDDATKH